MCVHRMHNPLNSAYMVGPTKVWFCGPAFAQCNYSHIRIKNKEIILCYCIENREKILLKC